MNLFNYLFPISMQVKNIPLDIYSITLPFNNLTYGVDNIHYDVRLSPRFYDITNTIIKEIIIKHSKNSNLKVNKKKNFAKIQNEFKQIYTDIMFDAINKAKAKNDIQIDYLAQISVISLILKIINKQYESTIQEIKNSVKEFETRHKTELVIDLKQDLSYNLENKTSIIQKVYIEVIECFKEIQQNDLSELRKLNFGSEFIIPIETFNNHIIAFNNKIDDSFMLEKYVLLGRRTEDTLNYNSLLIFIENIFSKIGLKDVLSGIIDSNEFYKDKNIDLGNFLQKTDNVNLLINYYETKQKFKNKKKDKKTKNIINAQKKLLNYFYEQFDKAGLLNKIVAMYEMDSIYEFYCPPLCPYEVFMYLTEPNARKNIFNKLKNLMTFYNKTVSYKPLKKFVRVFESVSNKKKIDYLIKFLNGFAHYHRDYSNYITLKEAIDSINLTTDDKTINLSRTNNTLYEFIVSEEYEDTEKPIINHVVIKADVRGSTEVVAQMLKKDLNPATNFSLNFFDPITEILSAYDAVKVFIEGDAIILSIFEHKARTETWYSVARACGLAINMLKIINKYNQAYKKYKFPLLELGIGIAHNNGSPTFFFDGSNKIMISSAINLADRLSGCKSQLKDQYNDKPFNLYVFQHLSDDEIKLSSDNLFLRYNVKGIELCKQSFEKLSTEIKLKFIKCSIPELQKDKLNLYTGKFPTIDGRYQRLVIRQAKIQRVTPVDFTYIEDTDYDYYEVCTNVKVFKYLKEINWGEK